MSLDLDTPLLRAEMLRRLERCAALLREEAPWDLVDDLVENPGECIEFQVCEHLARLLTTRKS